MTCDGQEWLGIWRIWREQHQGTLLRHSSSYKTDKDDKDKEDQTEDNREMSDKLPDCSYDQ